MSEAARKTALKQAKYFARRWFENGWGKQVVYCYDVIFPDGSRDIGIKDKDRVNGFEFIYVKNAFAVVEYDGKLTTRQL